MHFQIKLKLKLKINKYKNDINILLNILNIH